MGFHSILKGGMNDGMAVGCGMFAVIRLFCLALMHGLARTSTVNDRGARK